jgi:hypothetical protein
VTGESVIAVDTSPIAAFYRKITRSVVWDIHTATETSFAVFASGDAQPNTQALRLRKCQRLNLFCGQWNVDEINSR